MRPRLAALLAALILGVGVPAALLVLTWQSAYFDPRLVLVVPACAVFAVLSVRAKIVVGDGVAWRRAFVRYRPCALSDLVAVEARRARYLRREGLPFTTIVRAVDAWGRTVRLKPMFWVHGAGPLLAVLAARAEAGGVVLDDATRDRLSMATQRWGHAVPSWAYVSRSPSLSPGADPFGYPATPPASGARRRPPRRAVIAALAAMAVVIPATIVIGRTGTHALRSARCNSARGMWTTAADVTSGATDPLATARTAATNPFRQVTGRLFRLDAAGLANSHNTAAVQADSERLVSGAGAVWTNGNTALAEVEVAEFATHADALTFERDWGEDHCHAGDRPFATPGVTSGVGFRCECYRSSAVDRVEFVRGRLRVQVNVWGLKYRAGHSDAVALSGFADQAVAANDITR